MKKAALLVILLSLISGPDGAHARSAADVLAAFRQLQQKCETGITGEDYSRDLAGIRMSVGQYLKSRESRAVPAFSRALEAAVEHYGNAESLLKARSESGGDFLLSSRDQGLFRKIKGAYPELAISEEKDISRISYEEAVQIMWAKAASEIEKASDNYPTSGSRSEATAVAQEREMPQDLSACPDDVLSLKEQIKALKKENKELRKEIDRRKARMNRVEP